MKTYLVPVDFSDAAKNAAHFAAQLSHQTDTSDIILMNAFYISPYETLLPNPDMLMLREQEIEEDAAKRIKKLNKLKKKLETEVREGVNVRIRLNRSHLLRAVVDTVIEENVDLVFLGSKGNSSAGVPGIGSHVINVSKASPAPIIVVPPGYQYSLIDKAVIACDFKQVTENMPMEILHKLLGNQQINLMVLNIDNEGKHATADAEQKAQETALHGMLKQYRPQYHYVASPDVIEGILNFAGGHNAQLVIALPHKYSFFQSLLHSSISQQLASNSEIPVLLLK
ncbi:universal stress protein [Mucilaginibacter mali]|uniref:Universal stress protein n=1 Tax=Mucilaginibacter mali TaxID=2740462 RepID=A0A7D4Q8K0_9SPHI|nr:universal stress protein [Mucilaginibacter mali]QKJ29705.1 universal stress protein [Mucilaginibacter mali]